MIRNLTNTKIFPHDFLNFYDPGGPQRMLWKWFAVTVSDSFASCSQIEKENIVLFFERMNGLLEGLNETSITDKSGRHE